MDRQSMVKYLEKVARPVLEAGAKDMLNISMVVEEHCGSNRGRFSGWEAVCRLLCGISPWLDSQGENSSEQALQAELGELARATLINQLRTGGKDSVDFENLCYAGSQILVDSAFLSQAILRAPVALWEKFSQEEKNLVIKVLKSSAKIRPWNNNWLLFSAEVEAALYHLTGQYDAMHVDYPVKQFMQWYKGDGFYGDGPLFAMDYYNSFVIHPILLDVSRIFDKETCEFRADIIKRAVRYGEILERMIAADGSFIAVGRSIAYRCGAFHLLSQLALEGLLKGSNLSVGGVRSGLSAVIQSTLRDTSFRDDGFLKIGLCGGQLDLGETYISTGSLYLASTAFLVLGLPGNSEFWTAPESDWTQKAIWSGANFKADHVL